MDAIDISTLLLQASIQDTITSTIGDVIAYLPTLLAALLVLVVGYVVGRVLGGLVTRVVERIGVAKYTRGTALDSGDGDNLARILGKLVAYYVYFVAILAAANILDIPALSTLLGDIGAYLPVILAAVVVLVLGFVVGRIVGDLVADFVGGFGIGPYLRDTPLERFGDTEGEFGRLVGTLVTYYIYLLTLLTVADIVEIPALSELLATFVTYLPALAGGLVVLLVGIWLAERLGALVAGTDESRVAGLAGIAVKVLVYYITVTIALSAIGFDTTALTNLFTAFVAAFFGALAIALAIGIGVAVGLGGQEYVGENIDDWMRSLRGTAAEMEDEADTDDEGGTGREEEP
ncbi:mechanosensitive ion channel family protein [Haloarcula marina]|uniref:mechanosensitive ion channel family protein n=1 Tax=Haloarcula marina TaxID=2961574 RepID=UPI0020B7E148|nr:hypothetical protein [Halomicroarcula marina]